MMVINPKQQQQQHQQQYGGRQMMTTNPQQQRRHRNAYFVPFVAQRTAPQKHIIVNRMCQHAIC